MEKPRPSFCCKPPARTTRKAVEKHIRETIQHFGPVLKNTLEKQRNGKYTVTDGTFRLTGDLRTIREFVRGLWLGLCIGDEKNRASS